MLSARGRVVWMAPTPAGPRPRWALGVAFDPLAPEAEKGLHDYLGSNRVRVGVAYAGREEGALLRHVLEGYGNLLFADTADGVQALATRANVGAIVLCGDEARAFAGRLDRHLAGGPDALALGERRRPRPVSWSTPRSTGASSSTGSTPAASSAGFPLRWRPRSCARRWSAPAPTSRCTPSAST
jgi:hypothetical protein